MKKENFPERLTYFEGLFKTSEESIYNFVKSSAELERAKFSGIQLGNQSKYKIKVTIKPLIILDSISKMLTPEMVPTCLCSFPPAKSMGSAPSEGGCIIISLSRGPRRTTHSCPLRALRRARETMGARSGQMSPVPAPLTKMPVRRQ